MRSGAEKRLRFFIENILYTVSGEKIVAFNTASETDEQTEFPLN